MSYRMETGYAYKRVRGGWQDVVVSEDITDKAAFEGFYHVEGHRMGVFKLGHSYYAQLPQNLRRMASRRMGSRRIGLPRRNPRTGRFVRG